MTIAAELPTTPQPASRQLLPAAGIRSVHEVLDRLDAEPLDAPGGVSPKLAARLLGELDRAVGRLQGLRLSVVAAADRAQAGAPDGFSGTGAWLAATTHTDSGQAAREVTLATDLSDGGLDATREAVTSGQVSQDKAGIIAQAVKALPPGLSPGSRQKAEAELVQVARSADQRVLRKAGRQVLRLAQDEVDEGAARDHESTLLGDEQGRAYAKCRLTMFDHGDGTTSGSFTLPTPTAAVLAHVVQQMTSPRRSRAGDSGQPGVAEAGVRAGDELPAGASLPRGGDWAHRHGKALADLVEHLPTDHLHGKVAATVVVTTDRDDLVRELGLAHQDTGQDLTASEARRLACNAGILPAVLAGASLPLDLGRQTRLFNENQRLAVVTRYDTCAAHGCDRPAAWAELHHQTPWAADGLSDLANAVPLCGFHHRRVHDPTYDATITTDAHGIKTVRLRQRVGPPG
jgi:hypothetical protein